MNLLQLVEARDSPFRPLLSTGSLYDVQTGVFVPGAHRGMILNGGISTTNAYVGREQRFKSTQLMSHMMAAMTYYPDSVSLTLDTEHSLKKDRIVLSSPRSDNHDELKERMTISSSAEIQPEDFFDKVKTIAKHKMEHPKDFLVESPFIDPKTGQPIMMFIPTFVVIDSWSQMKSIAMQLTLETKVLGSSDTNMIYMRDGNVKKMIMAQIPTLAVRAGLYFFLSAHIGDVHSLDPYAPKNKDLPNMRAGDTLKQVGSDFNFLVSNSVEMRSVVLLQDPDKHALYGIEGGSDIELNEVTSVLTRCKNNASGSQLPTVISQKNGIMADLTNYHYLRSNDYFGLLGNKVTHKPAMTDISMTRNTVRSKLVDKKTARAIELLAQLCYIQNNWVTDGPVNLNIRPEVLAEKLLGSDGPTIDDIVSSRGYWTYDKENKVPYLSIYDVVAIAQGTYKAEGISLVGLDVPKEKPVKK